MVMFKIPVQHNGGNVVPALETILQTVPLSWEEKWSCLKFLWSIMEVMLLLPTETMLEQKPRNIYIRIQFCTHILSVNLFTQCICKDICHAFILFGRGGHFRQNSNISIAIGLSKKIMEYRTNIAIKLQLSNQQHQTSDNPIVIGLTEIYQTKNCLLLLFQCIFNNFLHHTESGRFLRFLVVFMEFWSFFIWASVYLKNVRLTCIYLSFHRRDGHYLC